MLPSDPPPPQVHVETFVIPAELRRAEDTGGVVLQVLEGPGSSEEGLSIPGAKVTLRSATGARSASCDVDGEAVLLDLEPGTWTATADPELFAAEEASLVVLPGWLTRVGLRPRWLVPPVVVWTREAAGPPVDPTPLPQRQVVVQLTAEHLEEPLRARIRCGGFVARGMLEAGGRLAVWDLPLADRCVLRLTGEATAARARFRPWAQHSDVEVRRP